MRFARNSILVGALAVLSGAAMSVPTVIDFENLTPIKPISGFVFSDVSFETGGVVGFDSIVGNVGSYFNLPTNSPAIENKQALVLTSSAPGGASQRSFTQMTANAYFTDTFSFNFAATVGLRVEYILDAPNSTYFVVTPDYRIDSTCTDASVACLNGTASITFTDQHVKAVRFFSLNQSVDAGQLSVIDNINYTPGSVIPEPSTYALMVIGLLGIGFVARRRMT